MSDYFLLEDQDPVGPFPVHEIVRMRESGNLNESDYIWRDGMQEWITIEEIFSTSGEIGQITIPSSTLSELNTSARPSPPPLPTVEDRALSQFENDSLETVGSESPLSSIDLGVTNPYQESDLTSNEETASVDLYADERVLFIGKQSKSFNDTFFTVGCLVSLIMPLTIPIVVILMLILRPFQKSDGRLTITNHRVIEEIVHADKSRSVRVVPLRNIIGCRVLGTGNQLSRFFVGDICVSYSGDCGGSCRTRTFRNLKSPFRIVNALSNAAREAKTNLAS